MAPPLLGRIARRTGQLFYLGLLTAVIWWGVSSASRFTGSVAAEVMAVRHPDLLASDTIVEQGLKRSAKQSLGASSRRASSRARSNRRRARLSNAMQ